jgi:hypothetical protein
MFEGGADQLALGDAGPLRGVEEALKVVRGIQLRGQTGDAGGDHRHAHGKTEGTARQAESHVRTGMRLDAGIVAEPGRAVNRHDKLAGSA